MLEVSEHIAAGRQVLSDTCEHRTALLSRVTRFAEAVVGKVRRDHIRRGSLFSLGHTQSRSVRLQQLPSRVAKPGVVTEFKCRWERTRPKRKEILEQHGICFQIRRQLKQHRSKFAGAGQRLDRRQKAWNKIL